MLKKAKRSGPMVPRKGGGWKPRTRRKDGGWRRKRSDAKPS